MSGISGYGAYAQPLIQERLSGQRTQKDEMNNSQGGAPSKASREELFRALLKTAAPAQETGSSDQVVRSDPGKGRGQFLDITV